MRKKSELIFSLILLPLDFLAILSAFVLAYIIRVKLDGRPVGYEISAIVYLKIFLVIVPVWILIFAVSGLYRESALEKRWTELGKIFVAVSGGTMFIILIDFVARTPIFPSKSIPVYGYLLSLLFVTVERFVVRGFKHVLYRYGVGIDQLVLIGSGPIAQQILADQSNTARTGTRIIAAIDSAKNASKRLGGLPVYASLAELLEAVPAAHIDEIIQADSALDPEDIIGLVKFSSQTNQIRYRFIPNQFGMFATNAELGTIAGLPVVEIRRTPLDGWGRIVKRLFDLVGATLGLVILSPILLIVALAIKFSDPGPVFYRHKRLSRNGEPVGILKFRTMKAGYSTGPGHKYKTAEDVLKALGREDLIPEFQENQKLENDPRVSRIGKILRKTSLDELPQLVNAFMGELSLVGPRPIIEAELERYGDQSASFLALKPGITGLWQVSGRSDTSYEERVKLDIYYVENWSLLMDIQILLKTVAYVVRGKGAY